MTKRKITITSFYLFRKDRIVGRWILFRLFVTTFIIWNITPMYITDSTWLHETHSRQVIMYECVENRKILKQNK